jgi:hypothetical protein
MPSSFFWTVVYGRPMKSSWSSPNWPWPFGLSTSEHAERQVLDADHLAHGVLAGEQRAVHGVAQQADLVRRRDVARREVCARAQRPVADREVVLVGALDRGVPVLVAGDHLRARAHPGDAARLPAACRDRLRVVERQVVWCRRPPRLARPRPKLPDGRR